MALKVSLIVLCHNGLDLTLTCLDSLRRQEYDRADIWVVDNASQDGTAEAVAAAYPEISLISTGDNLGYAGGNNVGMEAALQRGAEVVFLINNDTALNPQCVSFLVRSLQAGPQTGVIGPMVYTWEDDTLISSAGGGIDWHHADSFNIGAGEPERGQYPARPVDFINGCGLMVTRQAIERAGLLDPDYFMYWEETDWCARIKKAGFDIRFEPSARMRHKAPIRSDSLGPTTLYYMTRNRLLFFARHTPPRLKPVALAHALHGALLGVGRHWQAGRPEHARATQWAILHALQRRWGRADPSLWRSDPLDRSWHRHSSMAARR